VTVTGTGFAAGVGASFGGVPGTAVSVTSPTSLVVTSPAHATGVVDVQVTSGATSSVVTPADHYTYALVPNATTAPLPAGAQATGNVHLADVDCAATTRCTAVGYYHRGDGQVVPLVEQLVGTTWSATAPPLPTATDAVPDGRFTAVSCPTTTFCAAVGVVDVGPSNGHYPLVETWNGSAWSIAGYGALLGFGAGEPDPLASVSCFSATTCSAVGQFQGKPLLIWLHGSSWESEIPTLPAGGTSGSFLAVDCGGEALCTAVGTYHDPAGDEPLVAGLATDTWTLAKGPLPADAAANPQAALYAVDCFAGTDCFAVGKYRSTTAGNPQLGLDAERTGNSWGARSVPAPMSGDADPGIVLSSTSCPSDFCLAGGFFRTAGVVHALTVVVTVGITPHEVLLPSGTGAGPDGAVSGVVCPEVDRCAAVGTYTGAGARLAGFTTTLTGQPATYASALLPEPPGQKNLFLFGLSDDSPTTAVAVGNYTTTAAPNQQQGVLFTGVPVPAP
jgi:hypothetical protein